METSSLPPPLEIIIRLESPDYDTVEIPYKIEINSKILRDGFSKIRENWMLFGKQVFSLIHCIEVNPEIQIYEHFSDKNKIEESDNVHENIIEKIENEPFIADPDNFTVSWESDRYVMRNQNSKVIELSTDKNYIMIVKKRSKKFFLIKLLILKCLNMLFSILALIFQRSDLLSLIGPNFPESSRTSINIYIQTQTNWNSVSTST